MKRTRVSDWVFWTLWILTALGIAGVYWLIHAQETLSRELASQLQRAEDAVMAGDWTTSREIIHQVQERWEQARSWLALHTEHDLLQEIAERLLDAEALVRIHDPTALSPLLVARDRILHLPERDRLLLRNLF